MSEDGEKRERLWKWAKSRRCNWFESFDPDAFDPIIDLIYMVGEREVAGISTVYKFGYTQKGIARLQTEMEWINE